MPKDSKIHVISLHLDVGPLYWHKNFIKSKARLPTWGKYKVAIKARFGGVGLRRSHGGDKEIEADRDIRGVSHGF